MNSSQFRSTARNNLAGKWKNAVLITLVYIAILSCINIISDNMPEGILNTLLSLVVIIIEIPITYGLYTAYIKLYNNEKVSSFDFLTYGFENFKRAWVIALRVALKILIPIIILAISVSFIVADVSTIILFGAPSALFVLGIVFAIFSAIYLIVLSYRYSLCELIAIDQPELSTKEAVAKSRELLKGNKFNLFILQCTFIGWAILALLTFGIGILWFVPYMMFATIAFYMYLKNKNTKPAAEVVEKTENDNKTE